MCDVFATIYIDCMKLPIKEDKCKKEFDRWDQCCKNTYLSEFIKKDHDINNKTVIDKENIGE